MKITKDIIVKALMIGVMLSTTVVSPVLAGNVGLDIDIVAPKNGITDFSRLISVGIRWAIAIAALMTLIFLIWGGIQWITSGGDKSAYESARNRITAALVGLAIVAAAWAIMTLVGKLVGIDPFNLNLPSASGNGTTDL